jgi:hypothetical protein
VFRLLFFPIRLSLKILRLSVRLTGVSNALVLGIGVLIGLAVAPTSGAEFRKRMQERLQERRGGGSPESAVSSGI